MTDPGRPRIGVSSCLLGEPVRYDGRHSRAEFIAGPLSQHAEVLSFCPEMGIGLGVPRPPIQLVGNPHAPRAVGRDDPSVDVSRPLRDFARNSEMEELDGFVFKSQSPSCGLASVKLLLDNGSQREDATGLFAAGVRAVFPHLPMIEDTDLEHLDRRNHFIERVCAYQACRAVLDAPPGGQSLQRFHQRRRLSLMCHDAAHLDDLAGLARDHGRQPGKDSAEAYLALFMRSMERPTQRPRLVHVLRHVLDTLGKQLDLGDSVELAVAVDTFAQGRSAPRWPLSTLRRLCQDPERHPYCSQSLVRPAPAELSLRTDL